MDILLERIDRLLERVAKMEEAVLQLVEQRTAKDWYTTAEVSKIAGRSDYTVREYCRKRQIPAEKGPNGRGWLISHADLTRLLNRELPLPEQEAHGRF